MANRIKYIRHPSYTEAQWQQRNPYLDIGEIAFIKDGSGKVINSKVGPGFFNDLPYFAGGNYPYTDPVTNVMGDASGVLQGQSGHEILRKILSPYQPPVLSGPRNNGGITGGSFAEIQTKEIGSALSTNVQVAVNLTNQANLQGATPLQVDSGGAFSNDGNFANGVVTLIPSGSISPTLPTVIQIKVKAAHTNGLSNEVSTYLKWWPRTIWGCSELADLTSEADVIALTSKQTKLTDTPDGDYFFGAGKYHWIAIPGMLLSAESLIFTDISNTEAPSAMEWVAKGAMTVNNGVGNYSYQLYRSPFYLTVSTSNYRITRSGS